MTYRITTSRSMGATMFRYTTTETSLEDAQERVADFLGLSSLPMISDDRPSSFGPIGGHSVRVVPT